VEIAAAFADSAPADLCGKLGVAVAIEPGEPVAVDHGSAQCSVVSCLAASAAICSVVASPP